jgi:hypothetical protein
MGPDFYFPIIIGAIIQLGIVYFIVKSATQSDKTVQLLKMQARLLEELAKLQGVPKETLNKIMGRPSDSNS